MLKMMFDYEMPVDADLHHWLNQCFRKFLYNKNAVKFSYHIDNS